MRPVRSLARVMLSSIFVISGARSLRDPAQVAERAKRVTDQVGPVLQKVHPQLPTGAEQLVRINGAVQLVGGLMFATGHLTRPAAAALAGTLVPTTVAGHPFWTMDDPTERMTNQIHFLKNLGLLGGLLLAAADTQGRPGLRWRAGHRIGHGRQSVQRAVRTARREARIAVRSASAARRLPG